MFSSLIVVVVIEINGVSKERQRARKSLTHTYTSKITPCVQRRAYNAFKVETIHAENLYRCTGTAFRRQSNRWRWQRLAQRGHLGRRRFLSFPRWPPKLGHLCCYGVFVALLANPEATKDREGELAMFLPRISNTKNQTYNRYWIRK